MQGRNLIPTSEALLKAADDTMAEVEPHHKRDWLNHPCTQGLLYLLEHARVRSWEEAEEGPEPHKMSQMVFQAQLARNLTEDLMTYIMDEPEEEND